MLIPERSLSNQADVRSWPHAVELSRRSDCHVAAIDEPRHATRTGPWGFSIADIRARHWITLSARTRTVCGTVIPSALAVLRLIAR